MSLSTPGKIDLKNLTRPKLSTFVTEKGLSAYRAKQIFSWLYRTGVTSFSQMTDLSKSLRESLVDEVFFSTLSPAVKEISKDGTIKYGFLLSDGKMIESVLIPEGDRNTLCVSSQVGCAMGCKFCLTGTMGFIRNLTSAEIVNQVCAAIEDLKDRGQEQLNNLVFMGMGEPLANFENLITALEILMDDLGLNFAERRTTISTCGIAPKIIELGEKFKANLAISLHAADNKTRDLLMPVNKTYPLEVLFDACRAFPLPRRKRIMFEYILIEGINDSDDDAYKLADILRDIPCKINLLPCNETSALPYKRPSFHRVEKFQQILWDADYTVILRSSRGADISAACGQLATEHETAPSATKQFHV